MNESVVDVEGLTKAFGAGPRATHALSGLDLTVEPGQVVGFLGPNGAGKTTTLRILLGLIRADGGRARLFGRDPWNDAVPLHRRLAYVPGDVALWPGMTGEQTLRALASLNAGGRSGRRRIMGWLPSRRAAAGRRAAGGSRNQEGCESPSENESPSKSGIPAGPNPAGRGNLAGRGTHDRRIPAGSGKPPGRTGVEARRAELIELFDLDPSKKMREYSKGSRQKAALVAAFSASADLLLLDEPTSGLDPLMEGAFRQCVRRARDEGAAILLSSHILSEVEKVCDAVTIVRAGRTVERGSLERVRSIVRTRVRAVVAADPSSLRRRPELGDVAVSRDPLGWAVDFTVDPAGMQDAVSAVACLGVRSLTAAPPSLEELFLRHYGAAEVGGDASGAAEGASGDAAGQGVADEPLASGVGRDASGTGRP